MVKNGKAKGTKGENELKGKFHDELGFHLVRNLDQTRKGGYDCSVRKFDDQDAPVVLPFAIEFKRDEKLSVFAMWKQAVSQVTQTCPIPVVAYRRNRHPWGFILAWDVVTGNKEGNFSPVYEGTAELRSEAFFDVAREWLI